MRNHGVHAKTQMNFDRTLRWPDATFMKIAWQTHAHSLAQTHTHTHIHKIMLANFGFGQFCIESMFEASGTFYWFSVCFYFLDFALIFICVHFVCVLFFLLRSFSWFVSRFICAKLYLQPLILKCSYRRQHLWPGVVRGTSEWEAEWAWALRRPSSKMWF